ncbi:MAG: hypothetical protein C0459_13740 [Chitinophaga sp.]|jgi:hypothetical protein|nr:hypothetical protein [Chitinophaga sp.]
MTQQEQLAKICSFITALEAINKTWLNNNFELDEDQRIQQERYVYFCRRYGRLNILEIIPIISDHPLYQSTIKSLRDTLKSNIKIFEDNSIKFYSLYDEIYGLYRAELFIDYRKSLFFERKMEFINELPDFDPPYIQNKIDSLQRDIELLEEKRNRKIDGTAWILENLSDKIYKLSLSVLKDLINECQELEDEKVEIPELKDDFGEGKEYFRLAFLEDLYEEFAEELFEKINKTFFCLILNKYKCKVQLTIRKGKLIYVYYLINAVHSTITNPEDKATWLKYINEYFNIEYETYNKKKGHIRSEEANETNIKFANRIDKLLNAFKIT